MSTQSHILLPTNTGRTKASEHCEIRVRLWVRGVKQELQNLSISENPKAPFHPV